MLLRTASGEQRTVHALPSARVWDVKREASEPLRVPPECQELTLETAPERPLADSLPLEDVTAEGAEELTLLVTVRLDQVIEALLDAAKPHARLSALDTAACLGSARGEAVIPAVASCLEDHHGEIRQKALETLGSIANWGDKGKVAEASARLASQQVAGPDSHQGPRQAALAVLADLWDQLTEEDDSDTASYAPSGPAPGAGGAWARWDPNRFDDFSDSTSAVSAQLRFSKADPVAWE